MKGRKCRAAAAAAFAAAVVLAACGSPSAKYISNRDMGVFIKVPNRFTVFNLELAGPVLAALGTQVVTLSWSVGFDGSPEPARSHFDEASPESPVGTLKIIPIADKKIDHSISGLISVLSAVQKTDGTSTQLDFSDLGELSFPSGHWGVRLRVDLPVSTGGTVPAERLALFDSGGTLIYLLEVRCSEQCFEREASTIDDIFQSLTMKAVK
jgi:hypothetical protein